MLKTNSLVEGVNAGIRNVKESLSCYRNKEMFRNKVKTLLV
jgi:hypothetical protein